jgi:hypothetical protein
MFTSYKAIRQGRLFTGRALRKYLIADRRGKEHPRLAFAQQPLAIPPKKVKQLDNYNWTNIGLKRHN